MLVKERSECYRDKKMPESGPKECPMCGGSMQLKRSQIVTQVPGNPEATTRPVAEWVCPDCDYYEEAEGENA